MPVDLLAHANPRMPTDREVCLIALRRAAHLVATDPALGTPEGEELNLLTALIQFYERDMLKP